MRMEELLRRLPAPIVTMSLIVLVALAIGFWGSSSRSVNAPTVAQIPHMRATLADGACEFSADVSLASRWSGVLFAARSDAVRLALIDLLHWKSRYMVDTPTSREAVRHQMVGAVNRVIGSGRATELRFTEFELE
jgi:hypothetical protein